MNQHRQWTNFLRQLDDDLDSIRRQLEPKSLHRARATVQAFCEGVTRAEDTNLEKRLLNEPGKVLLPGWKKGVVQTLVFDCLKASKYLTEVQALDLHAVFGELERFLREGTTPHKQSNIAPDAASAIKSYLSERGLPKKRGPKKRFDNRKDETLVRAWNTAKQAGVSRKQFCRDQGIKDAELRRAQGRLRWAKSAKRSKSVNAH